MGAGEFNGNPMSMGVRRSVPKVSFETERHRRQSRAMSIVSMINASVPENDDGEDLSGPTILNEGVQPVDYYFRFLFPLLYCIALIVYFKYILHQPRE